MIGLGRVTQRCRSTRVRGPPDTAEPPEPARADQRLAELRQRRQRLQASRLTALRHRSEALKAEREEYRKAHPLAYVVLWEPECPACEDAEKMAARSPAQTWHRGITLEHLDGMRHRCPECGEVYQRTSQRVAAQAMLGRDVREGYLFGGNRSGKSFLGRCIDLVFALGRDHPDVQAFAQRNRLDLSRVQPGPGRVWSCAQTFGAAREYVRPMLAAVAPEGAVYRAWDAYNEALLQLPNGAEIVSKAVEQARGSASGKNPFEGAKIHAAGFDEEPQVRLAVDSTAMRLVDHGGPMFFTMTPLSGWTPFLKERVGWMREGKPAPQGVAVAWLHGEHNPHIDARELLARLRRYPESVQRARRRGEITNLEGGVHPDFDRTVHVVPAFDPPEEWPRFGGIDFGTRDPFVHLWFALDQGDDVLHVFREHYQREATLRTHADAIWSQEACPDCQPDARFSDEWWAWLIAGGEGRVQCDTCGGSGRSEPDCEMRWADPANLDSRGTLNGDYGIATAPANKDRRTTFEALFDRFSLDAEGRPHIVIHECCHNTIREIEGLTWNERSKQEMETKGDDHAHDVLRYVCRGLQMAGYSRDTAEEAA